MKSMWGDFLEEPVVMDIERYEGLYDEDGYQLSTIASVYVPWFQCALKCRCEKEQPMSELDRIFCKCILCGIDCAEDISFVLSLDTGITKGELAELAGAGIVEEKDGKFRLTESGKISFEKKSKVEVLVQEYPVYLNAITGEWSIEEQGDTKEAAVANTSIRLAPVRTAVREDIENHDVIRQNIQEKYEIYVISVQLLDYKVLMYQEERILFYENDAHKILFAFYNVRKNELDTVLADSLLKKYKRREVLELMQAEKHLEVARNRLIQENQLLSEYKGGLQHSGYLRNRDIRELLKRVLDEAEKEIFIISPWLNHFVLNDLFLSKMENALRRGVSVTIGYGYISEEEMKKRCSRYKIKKNKKEMEADREWRSLAMAQDLQKRFASYASFQIFYVKEGTHEKVLSYDEKYTLMGSYNLLSYDGGEQRNYQGFYFRSECGVLIENADFARDVKARFHDSRT